jgi:uncharacterized Fe-S cluster protein YjdI
MDKKYTNGEVTILWKPDLCIHAGNCVQGLPKVFRPKEKPWIQPEEASSQALIEQVKKCPSGALSIFDEESKNEKIVKMENSKTSIEVIPNGPVKVGGPCEVQMPDGTSQTVEKGVFLCRCGASTNKPFCDGSHRSADFSPDQT